MAPHSCTLAWKIPWTEEPGRLQSLGSLRSDTTERLHFDFSLSCIGAGNGNPLQCSCLENPRDRGVWWAAVYGVTQSRTRLKRLSSSSSIWPHRVFSCGMQDLHCAIWDLSLLLSGFSLVGALGMQDLSSLTRNLSPALEGRFLTTGPPGKSLILFFQSQNFPEQVGVHRILSHLVTVEW